MPRKYAKINLTKRAIEDLKDYERNNKIHPGLQKDVLEQIIDEVGYDVPIVIDKNNVIIAGHARREVLQRLGYDDIDVVIKDALTVKQVQKYRLLDNKVAELAENHLENITLEVDELGDMELAELYGVDLEKIDVERHEVISQAKEDFDFEGNPIRQVTLHFSPDEFVYFGATLDTLMEKEDIESYSDAIIFLIKGYEKNISK